MLLLPASSTGGEGGANVTSDSGGDGGGTPGANRRRPVAAAVFGPQHSAASATNKTTATLLVTPWFKLKTREASFDAAGGCLRTGLLLVLLLVTVEAAAAAAGARQRLICSGSRGYRRGQRVKGAATWACDGGGCGGEVADKRGNEQEHANTTYKTSRTCSLTLIWGMNNTVQRVDTYVSWHMRLKGVPHLAARPHQGLRRFLS
jgi:hypothetical protein